MDVGGEGDALWGLGEKEGYVLSNTLYSTHYPLLHFQVSQVSLRADLAIKVFS
jgi:hypothetical protein